MPPTLHVSCAVESDYVAHSAAMLHSVLRHSGSLAVHVHYLPSPRVPQGDRELLAGMVTGLGGQIDFHEITDERVGALPRSTAFPPSVWRRIFLPELIPDVDRVLYLDADTIAMDDLGPLWATDLGEGQLGAVTNVFQHDHRHHPAALGLAGPELYLNSGVLLMDLAQMRRRGTSAALRDVALERSSALGWVDQDALSLVLGEERVALHPRWNCMNSLYAFDSSEEVFGREQRQEAIARPGIRHFEGPGRNKPWHADCPFPLRERYFEHRAQTPWPEVELIRDPVPAPAPSGLSRRLRRWLRP